MIREAVRFDSDISESDLARGFSHSLGGEPTFAEASANGEVAPKAAISTCKNDTVGSILTGFQ
jgi:hypothetical protein